MLQSIARWQLAPFFLGANIKTAAATAIKREFGPLIEKNHSIQEMTRKEFMDKLFNLCKDAQEEIPPNMIAEILRDYADRLD